MCGERACVTSDRMYRLRGSVEPFVDRHGALYFLRPGAADLVVHHPGAADVALVGALSSDARSLAQLLADPALSELDEGSLKEKLVALDAANLLQSSDPAASAWLSEEDQERFSRQLLYLGELGEPATLQRRMREATVLIIGCGGLGSWASAAVACLGLGHLILVDDDRVALSNLNRQILYPRSAVGRLKAESAKAWLSAFDPGLLVTAHPQRIRSPDDVTACLTDVDAVVLAADMPAYELGRWVNEACATQRIPFLTAGQLPPILKVGPTYLHEGGACFSCHEIALREESPVYDDYAAYRAGVEPSAPTLGPASGVVGSMVALELMQLLIGSRPATADAAVIIDMRTFEMRREEIRRRPDCPVCGRV